MTFTGHSNATHNGKSDGYNSNSNISDILRNINRYNEMQTVLNEETFGPLPNDSVIIVVQVNYCKL